MPTLELEGRSLAPGVAHDVKEYPGAGHSFVNRHNAGPLNPVLRVVGIGHHSAAAADAWDRILRWFDRYLVRAQS